MLKAAIKIGPADHGRRMSLADFDHAEVQEGHCYELGRGVIVVSDVPKKRHLFQVASLRKQLMSSDFAHAGKTQVIAGGSECKIMVVGYESERHPNLALYMTLPPEEGKLFWFTWIPELVIEVVSPGSELRDYQEKREEYLAFGVREYWVFEAAKREMLTSSELAEVGESGSCGRPKFIRHDYFRV